MIRTTILAGILLVMLSMAYSRPGAMPSFSAPAPVAAEEEEAIQEEPIAAPAVRRAEPPREAAVSVAKKEEPIAEEPAALPEAAEEPKVAEVTPQPAAPPAPAAPVNEPGRPISLLPPSMAPAQAAKVEPLVSDDMPPPPVLPAAAPPVQEAAAPAPLPEVYVPTRPVNAPQDMASRLTPDGKLAPASPSVPQAEVRAPMVAAVGTKFMTPQERSRELYKLAREMEDTFIENMTK